MNEYKCSYTAKVIHLKMEFTAKGEISGTETSKRRFRKMIHNELTNQGRYQIQVRDVVQIHSEKERPKKETDFMLLENGKSFAEIAKAFDSDGLISDAMNSYLSENNN